MTRKCIVQQDFPYFLVIFLQLIKKGNVFIMGYVTFSLGFYMVCCSIASLAVGYIYLSRSQQEPISNRLLI